MAHYKDSKNNIYGYNTGASDLVEIGIEEVIEILEANKTPEQLAEEAKLEAEKLRDEAMLAGADYNGYQVSFTKADGDGMLQVKAGFELGITETNIKFANGTILPMTAVDFPAFALWFVSKRNEFFV